MARSTLTRSFRPALLAQLKHWSIMLRRVVAACNANCFLTSSPTADGSLLPVGVGSVTFLSRHVGPLNCAWRLVATSDPCLISTRTSGPCLLRSTVMSSPGSTGSLTPRLLISLGGNRHQEAHWVKRGIFRRTSSPSGVPPASRNTSPVPSPVPESGSTTLHPRLPQHGSAGRVSEPHFSGSWSAGCLARSEIGRPHRRTHRLQRRLRVTVRHPGRGHGSRDVA